MDKILNFDKKANGRMKEYDVIIVNYNGEKIISDCLKSIYSSSVKPTKVIVYDNHSSDRSAKLIKAKFRKVILIEGKRNIGFGNANNEAIKRSKAPYILFINNDVIVHKHCSKVLLKSFENNNLAILNPLILKGWNLKDNSQVYSFGAEMNKSGFGYSLYDTSVDRTDLNCFSGACFMIRADVIKKIKFENNFFLYYEEPALSIQILMRNKKIGRKSTAKCYHLESYSSPPIKGQGICFRQYLSIQNRWYMIGKYWPTPLLISAMPLNVLHLIYNLYIFIKNGQINKTKIIYLSFLNLYRGRKKFDRKKNTIWTNNLPRFSLYELFNLQKKIYY